MSMLELMHLAPVIPVIVIDDAAQAVPLARALVEGGLPVLEVTLRTPAALAAVRDIARALPQAEVGVGTVLNETQLAEAKAAGARFAVSPGLTPRLAEAARRSGLPLLPGAATASEMMFALECGYRQLKFFPAEAAGGPAMLKAMHGPFPQLRFCPTGGITEATAPSYLALPSVVCVGASWLVPKAALAAGDWAAIHALAQRAAALPRRAAS